jgi:glutamyl/glutaminyl-tRNA synthetase
MTNNNLFEVATRSKIRFLFKGIISVEDLWDLTLENLDSIYKSLNSQLKTVQEESLLNTKSKEDKELDIKVEIVKHIVKTKLEEKDALVKAKEKKQNNQKVMEIIANKKDAALLDKSVEELEKMLIEE